MDNFVALSPTRQVLAACTAANDDDARFRILIDLLSGPCNPRQKATLACWKKSGLWVQMFRSSARHRGGNIGASSSCPVGIGPAGHTLHDRTAPDLIGMSGQEKP
ncbi:hypothetical protein [uncultured Desulfosarcina sp.]|uniref:hypothetical protein n=1 Tax=uncultured Desulfosarcina sp. TaxID=218289 RepID=UPI0029C81104|nr:hypothetical protein [uncultured Desulfosarcina sp.]